MWWTLWGQEATPGRGISVGNGTGGVVDNNRVKNTNAALPGNGSTAIAVGTTNTLVDNNRLTNWDVGVNFTGSGKYHENLTSNVTTPFAGGGIAVAPNN